MSPLISLESFYVDLSPILQLPICSDNYIHFQTITRNWKYIFILSKGSDVIGKRINFFKISHNESLYQIAEICARKRILSQEVAGVEITAYYMGWQGK